MVKTACIVLLCLMVQPYASSSSQNRIAAALIGSALGDTFGRVTSSMGLKIAIDKKYGVGGVASFSVLHSDDFIIDKEGNRHALWSYNTALSIACLKTFCSIRQNGQSKEFLTNEVAHTLTKIYDQLGDSTDQYFAARGHPVSNKRKALNEGLREKSSLVTTESNFSEDELLQEIDSGFLCVVWPLALVYHDDISLAGTLGDSLITMTHRHPAVRAASVALITGLSLLIEGVSVQDAVDQMIRAAERFDRIERQVKKNSKKIWARKNLSKENIARDEMLTSDMLRYAVDAAYNKVSADEVLGFMNKRGDTQRSPRGFLLGYCADEALAASVYLFVKHQHDLKALFKEGSRAPGNSTCIMALAGALAGAHCGYERLKQQGFLKECSFLENSALLIDLSKEASDCSSSSCQS